MVDEPECTPETVQLTIHQIRKLARLARLHSSDARVKIEQTDEEFIQVEFLDEYGYRVPGPGGGRRDCYAFVIRESGWSNPSVRRAMAALTR